MAGSVIVAGAARMLGADQRHRLGEADALRSSPIMGSRKDLRDRYPNGDVSQLSGEPSMVASVGNDIPWAPTPADRESRYAQSLRSRSGTASPAPP